MKFKELFNWKLISGTEFNRLKNKEEELNCILKDNEKSAYIKHWVNIMGCKYVYIIHDYSQPDYVEVIDIADNKLIYKEIGETDNSNSWYTSLQNVAIPEKFKSEQLYELYDPTDKYQIDRV